MDGGLAVVNGKSSARGGEMERSSWLGPVKPRKVSDEGST